LYFLIFIFFATFETKSCKAPNGHTQPQNTDPKRSDIAITPIVIKLTTVAVVKRKYIKVTPFTGQIPAKDIDGILDTPKLNNTLFIATATNKRNKDNWVKDLTVTFLNIYQHPFRF
jgi:hypothetical protein